MRILKEGVQGNDVRSLQQILIAKGYSVGHKMDDGIFGELTKKSVMQFQKDNKLDSDGIVGPDTFNEIWKR